MLRTAYVPIVKASAGAARPRIGMATTTARILPRCLMTLLASRHVSGKLLHDAEEEAKAFAKAAMARQ